MWERRGEERCAGAQAEQLVYARGQRRLVDLCHKQDVTEVVCCGTRFVLRGAS